MTQNIQLNGDRDEFEQYIDDEEWLEALRYVQDWDDVTEFRIAAGSPPELDYPDTRFFVEIFNLNGNYVTHYNGPVEVTKFENTEEMFLEYNGFHKVIAESLEEFTKFSIDEEGYEFEESVEVIVDEIGIGKSVVYELSLLLVGDKNE